MEEGAVHVSVTTCWSSVLLLTASNISMGLSPATKAASKLAGYTWKSLRCRLRIIIYCRCGPASGLWRWKSLLHASTLLTRSTDFTISSAVPWRLIAIWQHVCRLHKIKLCFVSSNCCGVHFCPLQHLTQVFVHDAEAATNGEWVAWPLFVSASEHRLEAFEPCWRLDSAHWAHFCKIGRRVKAFPT